MSGLSKRQLVLTFTHRAIIVGVAGFLLHFTIKAAPGAQSRGSAHGSSNTQTSSKTPNTSSSRASGNAEAAGPGKGAEASGDLSDFCQAGTGFVSCLDEFFAASTNLVSKNLSLFKSIRASCDKGETIDSVTAKKAKDYLLSLDPKEANFYALIATAYGEARGMSRSSSVDPPYEMTDTNSAMHPAVRANMLLVMRSIKNRLNDVKRRGQTVAEPALAKIALQSAQYSPWNTNDPVLPCLLTLGISNKGQDRDMSLLRAIRSFMDFRGPHALSPGLEKATHFYASWMKESPDWSMGKTPVSSVEVALPPPPKPKGYRVSLPMSGPKDYHRFYNNIGWTFANVH